MTLTLVAAGVVILLIAFWIKRARERSELKQHSISPEDLRALLSSRQDVLVYDVRQPLDLLADSEIIPGATRMDPKDVIANPSLIPREKEIVVYCTCPSDKTARSILQRALANRFFRIKFLKGGLEAWKARGYPVEPYDKPFHLDSAT
jgi:rhodanese-related sulfurtransferase